MRKFKDLPMTTGKSKTYAGIGHRDLGGFCEPKTKEPVERVMYWLAGELEKLGYTLNSGGALGADSAFEAGVRSPAHKNVFTPADATEESRAIAQELHPAHERLQGHALDLYARNTNQIFGRNLDVTVDFVVCYTKDGCETAAMRTRDSGGTGQAIEMADRKGAPVFNMKNPDWFTRLKSFLNLPFDLPTSRLPVLNLPKPPAKADAKPDKAKINAPNAQQIKNLLKAARR